MRLSWHKIDFWICAHISFLQKPFRQYSRSVNIHETHTFLFRSEYRRSKCGDCVRAPRNTLRHIRGQSFGLRSLPGAVNIHIRTLRIPVLVKSLYFVRIVKYLASVPSWKSIAVFYFGRDFCGIVNPNKSSSKIVPVVHQLGEFFQIWLIGKAHPIEEGSGTGNIGIERIQ